MIQVSSLSSSFGNLNIFRFGNFFFDLLQLKNWHILPDIIAVVLVIYLFNNFKNKIYTQNQKLKYNRLILRREHKF